MLALGDEAADRDPRPDRAAHERGPRRRARGQAAGAVDAVGDGAPRPVSAESAAEALWPQAAPPEAMRNLQVAVSRLRRSLGPQARRWRPWRPAIASRWRSDAIDARRFETLIESARATRLKGDGGEARRLLDDALALWRGPRTGRCRRSSRSRRERSPGSRSCASRRWKSASTRACRQGSTRSSSPSSSSWSPTIRRASGLSGCSCWPCIAAGARPTRWRSTRSSRRRLDEELGLEPSSQLRRLQEAILRQDPSLDQRTDEPASAASPPSLPAQLRPRPTMPFVGRTAELGRLAALPDRARTDGRQIALVGGEPGSGKTRLARELAEHFVVGGMRDALRRLRSRGAHALPAARRGARAGPRRTPADEPSARQSPGVVDPPAAGSARRRRATRRADAEPAGTPMPSGTSCT